MRSLRARLVVGILIGISLFLVVNGTAVYVVVRGRMQGQMDRSLAAIARSAGAALVLELGKRDVMGGTQRIPDPIGRADMLFECWSPDGVSVERSGSLGEQSLPQLDAGPEPVFATIELPDGSRGRAVAIEVRPQPLHAGERRLRRPIPGRPPPGSPRGASAQDRRAERMEPLFPLEVVVAQNTAELDGTLAYLRWLLALAGITYTLGSAGILSWVVHRSLRPVEDLRRQIADLDEDNLDHTIVLADAPRELDPVVEQLNASVARIQQAFAREQAFTSHAAHELRTPLAGLRSTLEVALNRKREGAEYLAAMRSCLAITLQLQSVVETLLELARVAERSAHVRRESALLLDLVEETWNERIASEPGSKAMLETDIEPSLEVATDLEALRRVLSNLIGNALDHASPGSPVRVEARLGGEDVQFSVFNRAEDVSPHVAERALEPFWRGDSAHSDTGHVGLGLALCRELVEFLGGGISVSFDEGVFRVSVRLPSTPARDGPVRAPRAT